MRKRNPAALLLVDVIHPFAFEGADRLLKQALKTIEPIRRLREAFDAAGWPVIYCNDNFGKWRSDARAIVEACCSARANGARFVRELQPRREDYFILKPKHSAFVATPLQLLLEWAHVRRVYVAGLAGDNCVHATAVDAHTHDLQVTVVADATASETAARNRRALAQLEDRAAARVLDAAAAIHGLQRGSRAG